MGFFRFRKSFKVLPGVRLNVGKTGLSTSIGRPGATVNFRGDKVKTTVGIPGTGLSYSHAETPRGGIGRSFSTGIVLFLLLLLLLALVFALR